MLADGMQCSPGVRPGCGAWLCVSVLGPLAQAKAKAVRYCGAVRACVAVMSRSLASLGLGLLELTPTCGGCDWLCLTPPRALWVVVCKSCNVF